jgi:hypothetical protein
MFEEERPTCSPATLGMQYFTEEQRTCATTAACAWTTAATPRARRPSAAKVLVRIFERRIEIRDLQTQALLRTHALAERPGTVVLPMDERVFNPSRETRHILKPGRCHRAARRPAVPDAVCHRGPCGPAQAVGHRHLAERYPPDGQRGLRPAMDDGVHSYRHVKALTERLVARGAGGPRSRPRQPQAFTRDTSSTTLIRSADEYGELFAMATAASTRHHTSRSFPAMNMTPHEIERALRELRLSGMAATLQTRVMQAQAAQEPFLETLGSHAARRARPAPERLMERRFKLSGPGRAALAGRLRLALQPQAAAQRLLRAAHPEVHQRGRQRADRRQARHRQEPCGQGRGLPGHAAGL